MNDAGGVVESCHEQVKHITQSRGRAADTVGQVEPSFFRFQGGRSQAGLGLFNCIIDPCINDYFGRQFRRFDIFLQSPSDSAAGKCNVP